MIREAGDATKGTRRLAAPVPKRGAACEVRVCPRQATEEMRDRAAADVAKILLAAVREGPQGRNARPNTA